jgi:predicted transcriptional regulator
MNTLEKLGNAKVRDLMTRHLVSIMMDDTIQEVARIFLEHGLSTVPVISSNDKCIGIISRKDLTELFLKEDEELSRLMDTDRLSLEWFNRSTDTTNVRKVKELMTDNVSVIKADDTLPEACREMVRNRVHHLPVVDENEQVIGMLSTFDVVDAIANTVEKA